MHATKTSAATAACAVLFWIGAMPAWAAVTPRNPPTLSWVTPDSYAPAGAKIGDGVADATQYVQKAFDSGHPVRCVAGETYLVSRVGRNAPLQGNSSQFYALKAPAGLYFDGAGCTIKLATVTVGYTVANVIVPAGNDNVATPGITLLNVTIDPQGSTQPHPIANWSGGIFFSNTPDLVITNLTVNDAFGFCGFFVKTTGFAFQHMTCNGAHGIGWFYGSDDNGFALANGTIVDTAATNVAGDYWNSVLPGNGAVYVMTGCTVTTIRNTNDAGGEKVEGEQSTNSTFSDIVYQGGALSSVNSGFKIQGNPATHRFPSNITVSNVRSSDAPGAGLYETATVNTRITGYTGVHNATARSYPDIWIEGNGTHLDNWSSTDAQSGYPIQIRPGAVSPHVGAGTVTLNGITKSYPGSP